MFDRIKNLFGSQDTGSPNYPAKQVILPNGRPPSASAANRKNAYFDALNNDEGERTALPARNFANHRGSGSQLMRTMNRSQLSAIARWLYDNDGRVSYAVNMIAQYSSPVTPLADSPDAEWNTLAEDTFREWSQGADARGRRHTYSKLQEISCKLMDQDGDLLVYFVRNDMGALRLAFVEGWRIQALEQHDDVFDGVRIDANGMPVSYLVIVAGDDGKPANVEIPASEAMLLHDPERMDDYRGVTPLRRGSNDMRDVRDVKQFEKRGVKFASAIAATLKTPDGSVPENEWSDTDAEESGFDENTTGHEKSISLADMLGGDIPILPEGTSLEQPNNKRPDDQVTQFMEILESAFVSGLDIPPAFFHDSKLSGPNQRAVIGKAQRTFDRRQRIFAEMSRWVWGVVIADAIDRGQLEAVDGWQRNTFQFPRKLTIDAGRDAKQERDDVDAGLMSRREHFSNRSMDWQREIDQMFMEEDHIIEKAKALAQKHDIPVDLVLKRFNYEIKGPDQIEPEPNSNPANDDE